MKPMSFSVLKGHEKQVIIQMDCEDIEEEEDGILNTARIEEPSQ